MCGFLGFFSSALSQSELPGLKSCAERVRHRGNTDHGSWHDGHAALFHHRLAFRDIAEGKQPMESARGAIAFNGELYNFGALKASLAFPFKTRSDTEVLLAAVEALGPEALNKIDGEFAFIHWDKALKKITAGRDAFGVKPIFFYSSALASLPLGFFRTYAKNYKFKLAGSLAFASEIKALPGKREWCPEGSKRQFLGLYEEMGTSFAQVFMLPPGAVFTAELINGEWSCEITRVVSRRRKSAGGEFDFVAESAILRGLVEKSVAGKLDSDVPLGVYLSGGIDSRIAAYELGRRQTKIQSFTVGFEGADYDESQSVRDFVGAFPGITPRLLRTTNDALAYSYEHAIYASEMIQPYTNGCAKWWLSRFARRYVQGVLTGDGADEIFCGYPSYRYLAWWQFFQRRPSRARGALYRERIQGGDKFWEKGLSSQADGQDLIESQAILGWFHPLFAQIKSMAILWHGSEREALRWLQSVRDSIFSYVAADVQESASPLATWQNYFLQTHFPTHVLNWVGDRMEMANTLEGRPIYLGHDILSFMRGLPDGALVRGLRDKAVLRRAYRDQLGDFSRAPKKQFNAPFLQEGALAAKFDRESSMLPPDAFARAKLASTNAKNPLAQSFAQMFCQNAIVARMQEGSFLQGEIPTRDLAFEESFIDTHTTELK